MSPPNPTPIYRIVHIDNLPTILEHGGIYSANAWPADGLAYRQCHNHDVQANRGTKLIPCGPGGVLNDYVPFYFGYLSVMLLNLKTGRVRGYTEGQEPFIYLQTTVQDVVYAGDAWAFSDGHGLHGISGWFDDLARLDEVDWDVVARRYWRDTQDDPDRMRRKQAEFIVHRFFRWDLVQNIGVTDASRQGQVEGILDSKMNVKRPPVVVRRDWYY